MKIQRLLNDKKYEELIKMWIDPQYFLNWKDAKFSWEEKISLKHILDFLSGLEDLKRVGTYIQFYKPEELDPEDPVDAEVFVVWQKDVDDNIRHLDIFNSWERGNDIKHFLSLYKKCGSHWASIKAGLRGLYDDNYLAGNEGFERKPTNW